MNAEAVKYTIATRALKWSYDDAMNVSGLIRIAMCNKVLRGGGGK